MIESSKVYGKAVKLTYGMVGGGEGAFIGEVHRKAIAMDGRAEIVCGCFSRDGSTTLATGSALGLPDERLYASFEEMAVEEGKRDNKIDFAVVVTPNVSHYPAAKAFLENGINVVCDKPLTVTSAQAEELAAMARDQGLLFCVTYTYTGYPMVKHIRELIREGELGEIRFVNAEYAQDWLGTLLEETENKQAAWRADPAQAGGSNCVGDIGSHIENMVSYMTGLKIQSLCARLDIKVEGRKLDDNATIMVNYEGGATGLYWSSQIAVGHDNDLRVRIYGSEASIEWAQENPNYVRISYLERPTEVLSRGREELRPHAEGYVRIPSGHPEGYFEAFANIYDTFASALIRRKAGETPSAEELDFPTAMDGVQGVRFIEKCVESSEKGATWVSF